MTPEQLTQILDDLGRRLGPTGQHVFELAVRQVYINAYITLVESVIVLVLITIGVVVAAWFTRRQWKAEQARWKDSGTNGRGYSSPPDSFMYGMPWMLGGAFILFVAGMFVWQLTDALSKLLNPEYAALRDILVAIGGGVK